MNEQTDTPETNKSVRSTNFPIETIETSQRIERERNALRKESENWKRRHGNALELFHQSEEERNALRAEVERLKAACEKEFASVLVLDRENMSLKADKSRLDWAQTNLVWPIYPECETIREAIDAAMKGDK